MAWTSPMTAVAGSTFPAASFNLYVRDNLNETGPAKVTAANQILVSTAANALAARFPDRTSVVTSETTTSVTYVNLTTVGPAVTSTTGTKALVFFGCQMSNTTAASSTWASVEVSGASSIAASDTWAYGAIRDTGGRYIRATTAHLFSGLTAGSNIFTMKYRVGSNTGTFSNRELIVIPL